MGLCSPGQSGDRPSLPIVAFCFNLVSNNLSFALRAFKEGVLINSHDNYLITHVVDAEALFGMLLQLAIALQDR